mmetsp:Transcript_18520/g.27992  ORF Transcript_18520/g.27992 Transcript_18520/m.27992 type:complete len:389 (-) Transcript_18520:180-1346(-)
MLKLLTYIFSLLHAYSYVLTKPSFRLRHAVEKEDYCSFPLQASIVDADFERVSGSNGDENNDPSNVDDQDDLQYPRVFESNSMLDLTLEDNNATFPFYDPVSQNAISCKLAVSAELEIDSGKAHTYAVGVPAEHGVLLIMERGDELEYLDPDKEENFEFLEVMAEALHKELDPSLKLKKTPRLLTIEGDLDKYTNAVDQKLENLIDDETLSVENLMKTMDETENNDGELDSMFDFFKETFGDAHYNALVDEFEDGQHDPEFVEFSKLFDIHDDDDDSDTPKSPEEFEEIIRDLTDDIQGQGVGIRVVSYAIKQANPNDPPHVYSLVKPVKPMTLVGRLIDKEASRESIFELLSPEEELMVTPKLEEMCEEDMKTLGVKLKSSKNDLTP